MVFLVGCVVILPLVGVSSVIRREGSELLRLIPGLIEHPPSLSRALPHIPFIGKELTGLFDLMDSSDELLKNHLAPQVKELLNRLMTMLGSIGLVLGQVGFILFLMFFQYRDGVEMLE